MEHVTKYLLRAYYGKDWDGHDQGSKSEGLPYEEDKQRETST